MSNGDLQSDELFEIIQDIESEGVFYVDRKDLLKSGDTLRNKGYLIFMKQDIDDEIQKFALKLLYDNIKVEKSYDMKKKIIDEFGNMSNIVKIIGEETVEYSGFRGTMMERADFNLKEYIETTDYSSTLEETVTDIMMQLSFGVHKLHKVGSTHRDIKLQNFLFYSNYDEWTVADFDDLKVAVDNDSSGSNYTPYDYLAYEQDPGEDKTIYNFQTDIFSLGVIMKQLIDGYFVERGEKKIRTFYSDAKSKGVKLKDKNAYRDFIVQKINSFDVSDKLKNILSRMTAFADERYQSVDQVLADLRSDNVGPIMKPRDIYSEIEASYLKKAKKVTSTKSELLRAPQVEYLMDLHKEFENKVRSRLGDIVSKEELSNMMRFNEVDKNINDRYKSDTHYVSKEIREAENWWEKMKQQGQLVDEKRGPDGEILEQVWNVKTEAYENIENQRKKLVKKGKNFQPISKAWNKCYSIIEQYVR